MTKSPTRYEPDVGFVTGAPEMYVNTAGSYIKFEDYEQLKQRLDAVVAECARVQAFAAETARDAEEMATADGGGGGYIEALNELLTPATTAALAEVEAKAIEKAIEHLHCAISPTLDAITIVGVLNDFAKQVRGPGHDSI